MPDDVDDRRGLGALAVVIVPRVLDPLERTFELGDQPGTGTHLA